MTQSQNTLTKRSLALGLTLLVVAVLSIRSGRQEPPAPPQLREIQLKFIVRTNNLMHRSGNATPFTGAVVDHYHSGQMKSRTEVRRGKLNGESFGWHTNGVPQVREFFVDGVSHGLRTKWYSSDKKLSEAAIVNGELHGTFRKWHENGQLAQEIELKEGKPDGVSRAWHSSGFLKARAEMEMGNVGAQEFFDDGKLREAANSKSPEKDTSPE